MALQTENVEAVAGDEVSAGKAEDIQKPEVQKSKYTPRKKAVRKTPKNQLQWGD